MRRCHQRVRKTEDPREKAGSGKDLKREKSLGSLLLFLMINSKVCMRLATLLQLLNQSDFQSLSAFIMLRITLLQDIYIYSYKRSSRRSIHSRKGTREKPSFLSSTVSHSKKPLSTLSHSIITSTET